MNKSGTINLPADRYFGPNAGQKQIARQLYDMVAQAPLICPHGHVAPRLFADPDYDLGTPTDLFIIPDHYVFRMLYSQGIPLEKIGIPPKGDIRSGPAVEQDHRKIWQLFADHFYLFLGTPTGTWLNHELRDVFGVTQKLTSETAMDIYDQISDCLQKPEFRPRALYERFNIEVLTTTDAAADLMDHHRAIKESGWPGRILPTFRPDKVFNLDTPDWQAQIETLSQISGISIHSYQTFVQAIESRRSAFQEMGATASDHAALTPYTEVLSTQEADAIFQRGLQGRANAGDASRFTGHMLVETARMSIEDGMVMQLHVGSYRNHNQVLFERFGPDMGADIPIPTEYTRNLAPLLNQFGNDARLTLILFTLDETTSARELAPLAGHYPSLKLGPPWWFFDSINGLNRYFDQVMETAGIYNTVGFNDDTRAFPSIPARHDLWRRVASNWVAGLVVRGIVDEEDAAQMIQDLAYGLAKKAYKFD